MYVIYKTHNGEICRTYSGPAEQLPSQLAADESACEGSGSWIDSRVVDGQVVKLDAPRVFPFPGAQWSWDTAEWIDPRTLEQMKADRWGVIKAARSAAEQAPIEVAGRVFDADPVSLAKIMGAVQLASQAGQGFVIEWTLADNTTAALTGAEIAAVGVAIGQRTSSIYAHARQLRQAIESATTPVAVEAVTWEAAS